jgi:hypothetical protein
MTEGNLQKWDRPKTLKELAERSHSLEDFGFNLRDWQHEISRRVSSHKEFRRRIEEVPKRLAGTFEGGNVADAYLAAYAEWLANQASLEIPDWVNDRKRVLKQPWYADANQSQLEKLAPHSFRARGVYTVPDPVFQPRRGRPQVSAEEKRLKAIQRQRAYRKRIKALIEIARQYET